MATQLMEVGSQGQLTIVKEGLSAGYGALDIITEYVDANVLTSAKPSGSFRNATDIQRAAVTAVSAGVMAFSRDRNAAALAEVVHYGAVPLLEKSLVNGVLTMMKKSFRASHGQITIKRTGNSPATTLGGGNPGVVY